MFNLTEGDDVVEDGIDVSFREPEHGAVQVDVVAPRKFGLEPGSKFQERGEISSKSNLA